MWKYINFISEQILLRQLHGRRRSEKDIGSIENEKKKRKNTTKVEVNKERQRKYGESFNGCR